MRVKAAAHINTGKGIKWRSHEPSRIETFSDAVFAFALTLIVISMEVPKSFDMLIETMKGTVSFAVCFGLLFNIWNSQNMFFRRYGLTDSYIVALNAILLFVVLVYTYPLKFLFELVFLDDKSQAAMIHNWQIQSLMLIYSAGFIAIYILFYLMYRHAQKSAAELQLSPAEIYATKTVKYMNLICICISLAAIGLALISPRDAAVSGFVYCTFPIAYFVWFSYRGKKGRKLFPKLA